MKKIFLCAAAVIIISNNTGSEEIKAGAIDRIRGRQVTVRINRGEVLMMGDLLEVRNGKNRVILEVTFPMQTVARCRIREGKISALKKGMRVYRHVKGDNGPESEEKKDFSNTESFGGIVMIKLPAGSYIMGSPSSEEGRAMDEEEHRVDISPFSIGKQEVTQKQYRDETGKNPARFKGETLPVENISWYEAVEFCNRLSVRHSLKPYYNIKKSKSGEKGWYGEDLSYEVIIAGGDGFRLPTEAEWEYACRAGTKTVFHYGNTLNSSQANFNGNFPYNSVKGVFKNKPVKTGSYSPNPFGLYDMHGNISEWCHDCYDRYGSGGGGKTDCTYRVKRGGNWSVQGKELRSSGRGSGMPGEKRSTTGFRLARSL